MEYEFNIEWQNKRRLVHPQNQVRFSLYNFKNQLYLCGRKRWFQDCRPCLWHHQCLRMHHGCPSRSCWRRNRRLFYPQIRHQLRGGPWQRLRQSPGSCHNPRTIHIQNVATQFRIEKLFTRQGLKFKKGFNLPLFPSSFP